jgi:hypothetical protein
MPGDPQQPGTPYSPDFPGVPEGPLAGLQDSVAGVLNSADPHHVYLPTGPGGPVLQVPRGRQSSVLRDMAIGALAGFGSALVWRSMEARKLAKGEYTHPFFRFLAIWWTSMLAGFALAMIWPIETVPLLCIAYAIGTVGSLAYLAYRVTGHGRYNSRRGDRPFIC